jgi:hypothetical protein
MTELRPGGYMNYQADASRLVGTVLGPGFDGVMHLAITAENNGRRIGFYALDTPEAREAATEWLITRQEASA